MINLFPVWVEYGFIALVFVLAVVLVRQTKKISAISGSKLGAGIALWLMVTALLAKNRFFADYQSMPPRIPVFVTIAILAIAYLLRFSPISKTLRALPQTVLIGTQAYRIFVEILLAGLANNGLLPIEMTFNGRNFDILTGLTAPILAFWIAKKGEKKCRKAILIWNLGGLALLTNVVLHGMLSQPYPFQILTLSINNWAISQFPAIWLPLFLVPVAFLLHILSIMKRS